jgi:hypothetical protein
MAMPGSALLLPVLLAAGSPAASGEPSAPAARPNVSITLTVGRTGGTAGSAEKVYKVLGQEGSTASMLMGWRTPIVTHSSAEEEHGQPPSASYVYQNIGVSADLETLALGGGRLLVSGQIEISGTRGDAVAASPGGKPPLIGTFQQALKIVLMNGKEQRIAEAPDPDGGTLYLDLRVDLLE